MTAERVYRVVVLGRDDVGTVASDGEMRYYLTECCGASAKGSEDGTVCRSCYSLTVDELQRCVGDAAEQVIDRWEFVPKPLVLTEVYGDGLPYGEWKARYLSAGAP
jgi:hypothetical protein